MTGAHIHGRPSTSKTGPVSVGRTDKVVNSGLTRDRSLEPLATLTVLPLDPENL